MARFKTSSTEIQDLTDERTFIDYYSVLASEVHYDNTNSELLATNVQSALDELSGYLSELNDI